MGNNQFLVENGIATQEVADAQAQITPEQMREHLRELISKSPSRQRGRFTPDFSLTPEYEALVNTDTSNMSAREKEDHAGKLFRFKKFGTYTDEMRQAEIDNSLAIPLSEAIKLRDQYMEEVDKLEAEIDGFDISEIQEEADQISTEYGKRIKGANMHQRVKLQNELDDKINLLELEKIVKPQNALKVKRYEAIEKYKVYENRIKLYSSLNKEAIIRQIEVARDREIAENLLSLAEYVEG